jgi:hypothetical protein
LEEVRKAASSEPANMDALKKVTLHYLNGLQANDAK